LPRKIAVSSGFKAICFLNPGACRQVKGKNLKRKELILMPEIKGVSKEDQSIKVTFINYSSRD
jgi:hypothetical protein